MASTILVAGYGPGISQAVAEKFGKGGFRVALVARNRERLDAGVASLAKLGVVAKAFVGDLADEGSVRALVGRVREELGPIGVLEWTAYGGGAGDLLESGKKELDGAIDVALSGLLAAVRAALPDLEAVQGSVLVTNGGLGYFDEQIDAVAVQRNLMGLAIANAAKHKMVGLLAQRLKAKGVYVGEIVVAGTIKGSAFDTGHGTIDPMAVAEKYWELHTARKETSVRIS